MEAPELMKEIPPQVVNERAAYGPFDLKNFVKAKDGTPVHFMAELADGKALPKGLICTEDGLVTGIPGKGTQGNYEIVLTIKNEAGTIQTKFSFVIKPSPTTDINYIDQLKSQVWQALEQNLPIPDLSELFERDITPLDLYYLLERWGIVTMWDAFNLEAPGEKVLLKLEGASPHYNVYDRGSCLVMAPKDLYSYERTIADGLQTARAMAREVYRRNWTIEMAGFDKMMRAAWVEIQHLNDQHGKNLEIINYRPSDEDLKVYTAQAREQGYKGGIK